MRNRPTTATASSVSHTAIWALLLALVSVWTSPTAVSSFVLQNPSACRPRIATCIPMAKSKTDADYDQAVAKAAKAMTAFTNKYLANTDTKLCSDKAVPAVVIQGLAEHKVELGAPLCPCRFYDDKQAEAKDGYWNCPCVPMRERHECHCMLFLTEDNAFAGEEVEITYDEVVEKTGGMA